MYQPKWIYVGLLLILTQINLHGAQGNEEEDSNPLLDIASAFLQETGQGNGNGLAAVGGLVSSFMQSDAAKQIGDALSGGGASGGGGAAVDIISGISSLISGASGNSGSRSGGGGGIDPSMILNMVQMFSGAASEQTRTKRSQQRAQAPPPSDKNELGLDSIISMASSFMNSGKSNDNSNSGINMEAMMSLLPTIMNTVQAFTGPEAVKREESHTHHNYVLPPIFETIHIYWDHFMNSELGLAVWKKSGMREITASFSDEKGNVDYKRMFDMMENLSFRRKWIKTATSHIAKLIAYLADPEVQTRYLKTFEVVSNGFLKQYGYPKSSFFDSTRPEESLTDFANTAIRRHFEVKVDSGAYIKPAVSYVKDLIKLGQAQGYLGKLNSEELSDKVTDALNLDIIEPFLKVYRGYRYAVSNPECASYVLCELNTMDPRERDSAGLPTFKSGLTKLSSFAAAWFLSSETNHSFFTLYAAANVQANCQRKYPVDCSDFHAGEERVTTEYFHNEL